MSSRNPSTLPEVVLTRRELELGSASVEARAVRTDSVAAQASTTDERNNIIAMWCKWSSLLPSHFQGIRCYKGRCHGPLEESLVFCRALSEASPGIVVDIRRSLSSLFFVFTCLRARGPSKTRIVFLRAKCHRSCPEAVAVLVGTATRTTPFQDMMRRSIPLRPILVMRSRTRIPL